MANRFLNNITINDEYTLPSADGTADQIITTDGAGQLSFVDQSTLNSGSAERTEILVKNLEGSALSKGDPVYIIGSVGASERLEVGLADAGDAGKMPCVGLLTQDLAINGEGTAIVTGKLKNLITSPIDGATPTENDTIYVKSGGGLTLTKPAGSTNLIQNVGQVGRVSTSSDGNIVVSAILRTNDVPNLTTGKIWVGTANNTAESTVVHLDETNGRMGIGTPSPQAKLHVDGAIRVEDANDVVYANKFFTVSNAHLHIGANTGYDTVFFNGPVTERMRITSTGNVGIGTTGPDYKLEVDGTLGVSRTDGIIFAGSGGTGQGNKITSDTSNNLIFSTSLPSVPYTTTEKVRILNNGNVGIGVTNPGNKLEVDGNLKLGTTGDFFIFQSPFATTTFYARTANGGTIGFGAPQTFQQNVFVQGELYAAGGSSLTAIGTKRFGGWSNRIADTGDNYFNMQGGNFGIGTTSPQAKLHVANGTLRTWTPTSGTSAIFESTASNRNFLTLTAANEAELWFGNASTQTLGRIRYEMAGNNMEFWTNGTQKMVINSSGDAGIGTTSPGYKLDVAGDLRVDNGNVGSTSGDEVEHVKIQGARHFLKFKEVRTANDSDWRNTTFKIQAGVDSTNHQSIDFVVDGSYQEHIDIRTGNQVFNTRFTSTGNVGIGTTSPGQKLEVEGNIRISKSNDITSGFELGRDGSTLDAFIIQRENADLFFRTNNSERMRIEAGGNVGIGATNPSTKLQVSGTVKSEGLDVDGQANSSTNFLQYTRTDLTQPASISYDGTGGFDFNLNGGAVKFSDTNGGSVGIGTTSPQEKLHVQNYTTGESHQAMFKGGAVTVGDYSYVSLNNGYSTEYNKEVRLAAVSEQSNSNKTGFAVLTSPDSNGASGHERLRVTADGNVGIGTTSPDSKLHVKEGDITIEGFNTSRYLRFIEPDGSFQGGYVNYDGASNILKIGVHNANDTSTSNDQDAIEIIRSTGQVDLNYGGAQKLKTQSSGISINGILNILDDSNPLIYFRTGGNTIEGGVGMADATLLRFAVGSSGLGSDTKMVVRSDGNVGIGTTSPGEKLEVNGTVKATAATDAYKGYIKNTITCTPLMKTANTDYNYIPYNSTIFGTTPAYYNRMAAAYDGRVKKIILRHISGVTPTATGMKFKKEVNGIVSTTEYTATVTGGASATFTAIYNFANSDFTFSEGDSIGILAQTSGGTGGIGGASVQIIVEYNIT